MMTYEQAEEHYSIFSDEDKEKTSFVIFPYSVNKIGRNTYEPMILFLHTIGNVIIPFSYSCKRNDYNNVSTIINTTLRTKTFNTLDMENTSSLLFFVYEDHLYTTFYCFYYIGESDDDLLEDILKTFLSSYKEEIQKEGSGNEIFYSKLVYISSQNILEMFKDGIFSVIDENGDKINMSIQDGFMLDIPDDIYSPGEKDIEIDPVFENTNATCPNSSKRVEKILVDSVIFTKIIDIFPNIFTIFFTQG